MKIFGKPVWEGIMRDNRLGLAQKQALIYNHLVMKDNRIITAQDSQVNKNRENFSYSLPFNLFNHYKFLVSNTTFWEFLCLESVFSVNVIQKGKGRLASTSRPGIALIELIEPGWPYYYV